MAKAKLNRLKPKVVVNMPSVNQSVRNPVPLNLIVLHSTESHYRPGHADLIGIGTWFKNPNAQASSHVATDDGGYSARYVADDKKAWTCAAYNSASLNIEQIGYSAQGFQGWKRHDEQLWETARWIAEWSIAHKIPIRRAIVARGRVLRSGVTTHKKLGTLGGNHGDPGRYPFLRVLIRARRIRRERIRSGA